MLGDLNPRGKKTWQEDLARRLGKRTWQDELARRAGMRLWMLGTF
jgi:hypothetical protein